MRLWKRIAAQISKAARTFGLKKRRKTSPPRRPRLPASPPTERLTAPPAPVLISRLPPVPVSTAIEEFSGVQLSPHTQRAYKNDLRDFFSFLKLQGVWAAWNEELSPILIAQYRNWLVEERKLAKGSVTRKMAVLKSFFRWGQSRGWIENNPAELVRGFPQTQESKTGFLDDREIDQLLASLHAQSEDRMARQLARVVVETLLMLAVRRSEATRITAGDLELLEGRWLVRIRGKGDRDRTLPLPARLLRTWAAW